MDIVDIYRQHYSNKKTIDNDFNLIDFIENVFIGIDKNENTSLVIKSFEPNKRSFNQTTKMLSVEFNIRVKYSIGNNQHEDTVNILRCFSKEQKDRETFLELAYLFIRKNTLSEYNILDTFTTLAEFFSDVNEPSVNELVGLYAELYAISKYYSSLNLNDYWQSRDKMTYDFSISEQMKIEIKATTNNTRIHHFRHAQLSNDKKTYIISYKLKYDDNGLQLSELIENCRIIFENDKKKILKINYFKTHTSEDKLSSIKFDKQYTDENERIYLATLVPHIDQILPQELINVEYDCIMDSIPSISFEEFSKVYNSETKSMNK